MIGIVYKKTGLTDDQDDNDDEDNESSNELNFLNERDKFITENDDLGHFGSDHSNMEILQ